MNEVNSIGFCRYLVFLSHIAMHVLVTKFDAPMQIATYGSIKFFSIKKSIKNMKCLYYVFLLSTFTTLLLLLCQYNFDQTIKLNLQKRDREVGKMYIKLKTAGSPYFSNVFYKYHRRTQIQKKKRPQKNLTHQIKVHRN